ncbi:MAG: GAF domain-containing protein [Planctomycetes bacterium]|nr:GAF domain-containing protein [Planctomycetota bacterium]
MLEAMQAGQIQILDFLMKRRRRERVVVTDIETDPLWADFREASTKWNLRACWSQPILSSSGQLLGTFAMYYHKPRGPNQGELSLIEQAASIAALATERYRDEEITNQAERLTSLGTFAAGIAHEINNPVGAIQLAAEGAINAQSKGETKRVRDMLELILANTERCTRIVRGVLQFGRQSDYQKEPASLARILGAACEITQGHAASHGASVVFSPPDQDHPIVGRVFELEQVFVNLIRNAIESKNHGAAVTVQLAFDRDFARVAVADDGQGMNEEQKARMFDPFFTTRGSNGGTGLGLSIVHGILVGHGGSIHVDSKPKIGTKVVVCLPRTDSVEEL